MAATESPQATPLLLAAGAALVLAPLAWWAHGQSPPSALHWGLMALCGLYLLWLEMGRR